MGRRANVKGIFNQFNLKYFEKPNKNFKNKYVEIKNIKKLLLTIIVLIVIFYIIFDIYGFSFNDML